MTKDRVAVTAEEATQLVPRGSAFLSGRVGMQYGIARDAMTAPVEAAKSGGYELGLVPLPKGKGGRQNIDGPQAYGVGAASKAPDAAWQLARRCWPNCSRGASSSTPPGPTPWTTRPCRPSYAPGALPPP